MGSTVVEPFTTISAALAPKPAVDITTAAAAAAAAANFFTNMEFFPFEKRGRSLICEESGGRHPYVSPPVSESFQGGIMLGICDSYVFNL